MILLTHQSRILIGVAPADFRKGIDGFVGLCQHELGADPRSGTVFVFRNRAATMIRALCYEGGGYWLMTKRLSKGRFRHWPHSTTTALEPMQAQALRTVLLGGDWQAADNGRLTTTTSSPILAEHGGTGSRVAHA